MVVPSSQTAVEAATRYAVGDWRDPADDAGDETDPSEDERLVVVSLKPVNVFSDPTTTSRSAAGGRARRVRTLIKARGCTCQIAPSTVSRGCSRSWRSQTHVSESLFQVQRDAPFFASSFAMVDPPART